MIDFIVWKVGMVVHFVLAISDRGEEYRLRRIRE